MLLQMAKFLSFLWMSIFYYIHFVCVYVSVSACLFMCLCVCMFLCINICVYVCLCVSLSLCFNVCVCTFARVSVCVCMSLRISFCLCVCLCVCVCAHRGGPEAKAMGHFTCRESLLNYFNLLHRNCVHMLYMKFFCFN